MKARKGLHGVCNSCRIKKIKCCGTLPCEVCKTNSMPCSYPAIKKTGPNSKYIKEMKLEIENLQKRLAFEMIQPNSQDLSKWTCFTFYSMMMVDYSTRNIVTFIDYYFKYVYRRFPLFSQNWLESHMGDVPVYLLHAMYACCLVFPVPSKVTISAHRHYKYAEMLIYSDLETADPFTIAALLHLFAFALPLKHIFAIGAHHAVATALAKTMKVDRNQIIWLSRIGTMLLIPDFTYGLWLQCYCIDYNLSQVVNLPFLIESEISLPKLQAYELPVNSIEVNGPHNTFTFIKHYLPLVELSKQHTRNFGDLDYGDHYRLQVLTDLNFWHNALPPTIRFQKGQEWISRFFAVVNTLYLTLKLKSSANSLLEVLDQAKNFGVNPLLNGVVLQCLGFANQVTEITASFLDGHTDLEDRYSNVLQHDIFYAGVVHAAIWSASGASIDDVLFESCKMSLTAKLDIHLRAIKIMFGGRELITLQDLSKHPYLASSVLKKYRR